jgi:hypothetical protein
MDELLWERVKQLREISDALRDVWTAFQNGDQRDMWSSLVAFRYDLDRMIAAAEAEHEAF